MTTDLDKAARVLAAAYATRRDAYARRCDADDDFRLAKAAVKAADAAYDAAYDAAKMPKPSATPAKTAAA
jgi:hypothetical protein